MFPEPLLSADAGTSAYTVSTNAVVGVTGTASGAGVIPAAGAGAAGAGWAPDTGAEGVAAVAGAAGAGAVRTGVAVRAVAVPAVGAGAAAGAGAGAEVAPGCVGVAWFWVTGAEVAATGAGAGAAGAGWAAAWAAWLVSSGPVWSWPGTQAHAAPPIPMTPAHTADANRPACRVRIWVPFPRACLKSTPICEVLQGRAVAASWDRWRRSGEGGI